MPIEIRELVIRAVVDPEPRSRDTRSPDNGGAAAPIDRQALVQECVDQTLRVLRRHKER